MFCGESEAVARYQAGEDIYMYYAPLFPSGATRDVIKTCLIANMYGATDYSVAKRCNISQLDARYLLKTIDYSLPRMRDHKRYVIKTAKEVGYYVCPNGFDQSDLVKAYPYKGEFNKDLALSAYVQSALGVWMQGMVNRLKKREGTLLSVFDSILFEVNPKSKDIVKNWCVKEVFPFRVSEVRFGNNFYEVCK